MKIDQPCDNCYFKIACKADLITSNKDVCHENSHWQPSYSILELQLQEAIKTLEYIAVDNCDCGFPCSCYSWKDMAEAAHKTLMEIKNGY
jgi:hypothetical protein